MEAFVKIINMIVARAGLIRDGYQILLSSISEVDTLEPADNGLSAIARLDADKPDLIIIDSSLCIDEIKKILIKIRQKNQAIRSIVISSDQEVNQELYRLGTDTILPEETSPINLVTEVKRLAGAIRPLKKIS